MANKDGVPKYGCKQWKKTLLSKYEQQSGLVRRRNLLPIN
jgi:hypothetical protein